MIFNYALLVRNSANKSTLKYLTKIKKDKRSTRKQTLLIIDTRYMSIDGVSEAETTTMSGEEELR